MFKLIETCTSNLSGITVKKIFKTFWEKSSKTVDINLFQKNIHTEKFLPKNSPKIICIEKVLWFFGFQKMCCKLQKMCKY